MKKIVFALICVAAAAAQAQMSSDSTMMTNITPIMPPIQTNQATWWTNSMPMFTNGMSFTNEWMQMTNTRPDLTNGWVMNTNLPAAWTNLMGGMMTNRGTIDTRWTNIMQFTNVMPRSLTNGHGMVVPPTGTPPAFPADVQSLLKQFQQQRAALVAKLSGATDAQRQEILQELETLRQQLQTQLAQLRQTAMDQAHSMRMDPTFRPVAPGGTNNVAPGAHHGRGR